MKTLIEIVAAENHFVKYGDDLFFDEVKKIFADKKPIKETNMALCAALGVSSLILAVLFQFSFFHHSFDKVTSDNMTMVYFSFLMTFIIAFGFIPMIYFIKQPDYENIRILLNNRKKFLREKFNNMIVSDTISELFKNEYNIKISESLTNKQLKDHIVSNLSAEEKEEISIICKNI